MRAPRSVTLVPMALPSRSLKLAIDFLALVITGFWPAMVVRSLTAPSRSDGWPTASPTPMLITIFSSRGTCITLAQAERLLESCADLVVVLRPEARRGCCCGRVAHAISPPHFLQVRVFVPSLSIV